MADVKKELMQLLSGKEDNPMDDLVKLLNENKKIERVYFNDEGQWIFHKREGFPIEHSRDEILAGGFKLSDKEVKAAEQMEPETTDTTIEANQKQNAALPVYDITKTYKPKEMAAFINAAETPEQVNLYVRPDNKPETAELIKTKLASFNQPEPIKL